MTDFPTTDEMVRDLIVLIIGVLVAVVIGIFIFTNQLGSSKQEAMNRQDPAYQAAVLKRIKPYGRVVLDGETDAENAAPDTCILHVAGRECAVTYMGINANELAPLPTECNVIQVGVHIGAGLYNGYAGFFGIHDGQNL